MQLIHTILDYFLHLDKHLETAAQQMGNGLYLLLFAIVFCETGLVVTPFLPGDSLLFALGALAAAGTTVKLPIVIITLCVAANCGDFVNYFLGYSLGPKVFGREKSWLLNPKHLREAQDFYDRHGRMTIIMARFVPIIRTFAPFVAGNRQDALCPFRQLQHRRRAPLGRLGFAGRILLRADPDREEEFRNCGHRHRADFGPADDDSRHQAEARSTAGSVERIAAGTALIARPRPKFRAKKNPVGVGETYGVRREEPLFV